MAVKPLSDRVLVKPNPAEEKTAGGLFIPDTAKEKPLMGKVIAVGPGTAEIAMEVKSCHAFPVKFRMLFLKIF